jgi:hypothetical protein
MLSLFPAGTLLLLLQAPAATARSLLQGGGKTVKNRQDNELRASVATSDSILLAVRKGGRDSISSSTRDGLSMARKASSASASPFDFAPGGDRRRSLLQLSRRLAATANAQHGRQSNHLETATDMPGSFGIFGHSWLVGLQSAARKLLQGKNIGANAALSTWSVMSAAEDIQQAAMGGAQLMAVLDATQQGNKYSRQVSSRALDPSAFDKKKATTSDKKKATGRL